MTNTETILGADGHPWPQTMDAQAWVTAWMRMTQDTRLLIARDPDTMISWFANAIMAGYDEAERRARASAAQTLNPTEALYGFLAWLTTRSEPLTLGSTHECGQVVTLLREFCERNELPACREDYATLLKDGFTACPTCGGAGTVLNDASPDEDAPSIMECPSCAGPA